MSHPFYSLPHLSAPLSEPCFFSHQWFQTLACSPLEGLLNHRLQGSTPRVSDSVGV